MMSGRRVWFGPLMLNWLTASQSFESLPLPLGEAWLVLSLSKESEGCPQSISQSNKVTPRFAILLILHRHTRHQQLVKAPVGRHQRRNAQIQHLF